MMNIDNKVVCSKCVMDSSDPSIVFDDNGVCSHCHFYDDVLSKKYMPDEKGAKYLDRMIKKIKEDGKDNEYDCIIGLSGGADSSYMAIKIKEFGLRPLVIHVDAGWNSELAVNNIEKIVKFCDYDLHTCVMNWEDMRDLQLSYLKAGVSNQDVPQDHAFFASLYKYATKYNIKYILSGGNISTECVYPNWHGSAMDAINLKDIHRKYGTRKLASYTTVSFFEYYFWFPIVKGLRTLRPLNYMPYVKKDAIDFLVNEVGWKPYARKHGESVFTKFFQNHYLPEKFGYDKRRMHLSSLILTNQMTRNDAVRLLDESLYDHQELEEDIEYFCKKLRISKEEFDLYMNAPIQDYTDFKNWDFLQRIAKNGQRVVEKILGKKVKVYS